MRQKHYQGAEVTLIIASSIKDTEFSLVL